MAYVLLLEQFSVFLRVIPRQRHRFRVLDQWVKALVGLLVEGPERPDLLSGPRQLC